MVKKDLQKTYKPLLHQKNTKVFAKFLSNSGLIGVKPLSVETGEPIVVDNNDNTAELILGRTEDRGGRRMY